MANSYIEYNQNLSETTYDVPFNFLSIDDVKVKGYNGTTWSDLTVASTDASAKTVTLSGAPSAYQKIRVWRNTGTTQLVDFQNGSRLSESDLDTAYQQGLFVAQEVSENASTEVEGVGQQGPQGIQGPAGTDGTDPFDASGNLIVSNGNVGIGENSPNADLVVKQSGPTFTTSGNTVALFQRNTATGSGAMVSILSGNNSAADLNFADADDEDVGRIRYNHADNTMQFQTAASERMTIDSNGNVIIHNIPTSPSGLPSGAIYSDGGTLKIV